jgi:diacylglycerol kinase
MNNPPHQRNVQRNVNFWRGFQFAGEGLLYAFRTQRNFRVHLIASVAVIILGAWLRLPRQSWAILALDIGLVLTAEMINTAAEALVDLTSPEYHPLAKLVKDLMAGAVLIVALISVIVGLLILGPPLLLRLGF